MSIPAFALQPEQFLRSVEATRDTLGKHRIDVVGHVLELTQQSSYAIVGGLAQILWARKTHTADDLDIALVGHLFFEGSVVHLRSFRNEKLNAAIIDSALSVPDLGGLRFVRPELLLVTHLLRPGPTGALAAVELVIARRTRGGLDLVEVRSWAEQTATAARLDRVLDQATAFDIL